MTPALDCINVLEQLTELKEIFYLLDYQFTIKRCNSGRARWKRSIRQNREKGAQNSYSLQEGLSLQISTSANPKALRTPTSWIFTKVSLHRYDCLDQWSLATDSSSSFFPLSSFSSHSPFLFFFFGGGALFSLLHEGVTLVQVKSRPQMVTLYKLWGF